MSLTATVKNNYAIIRMTDLVFIRHQVKLFNEELEALKSRRIRRFLLDFSSCDYVSSEGLGALAELFRWCHDEGNGSLALVLPADGGNEVRYLFDIIGLSLVMKNSLFNTVPEAEAYLAKT
jgi:anti-anti-sigma regulatory factor